jgi:hypothetical protein
MKRTPGWLRWLAWGGFAALLLATFLVVVRWVVLGRGHARMQEIAIRQHGQPRRAAQPQQPPDSAAQSAVDTAPPQKWFSMTARSYGGRGSKPWGTINSQAANDQAGLAAALELQRRTMGQYPETLDAVGAMFPGGLPHDVATAQPYFYARTPDGNYKLWSTGIDQTNDLGDPKRDIVFIPPKVRSR